MVPEGSGLRCGPSIYWDGRSSVTIAVLQLPSGPPVAVAVMSLGKSASPPPLSL